ncbi:hypothetical protein GCM10023336_27230 [Streptomyces similanensis]|uniref:Uncharacterized protein n=1 Tax=Streptomyces similanensis TaxID=1274988 RepID=A0ABP9KG68_9ACTN
MSSSRSWSGRDTLCAGDAAGALADVFFDEEALGVSTEPEQPGVTAVRSATAARAVVVRRVRRYMGSPDEREPDRAGARAPVIIPCRSPNRKYLPTPVAPIVRPIPSPAQGVAGFWLSFRAVAPVSDG